MTNAPGNIIVILQENNFTEKDDNISQFSSKLHRAKKGNWYEFEEAKIVVEQSILRIPELTTNTKENNTVFKLNIGYLLFLEMRFPMSGFFKLLLIYNLQVKSTAILTWHHLCYFFKLFYKVRSIGKPRFKRCSLYVVVAGS